MNNCLLNVLFCQKKVGGKFISMNHYMILAMVMHMLKIISIFAVIGLIDLFHFYNCYFKCLLNTSHNITWAYRAQMGHFRGNYQIRFQDILSQFRPNWPTLVPICHLCDNLVLSLFRTGRNTGNVMDIECLFKSVLYFHSLI